MILDTNAFPPWQKVSPGWNRSFERRLKSLFQYCPG